MSYPASSRLTCSYWLPLFLASLSRCLLHSVGRGERASKRHAWPGPQGPVMCIGLHHFSPATSSLTTSSNKCLTTRSKKLLGAPGLSSQSKFSVQNFRVTDIQELFIHHSSIHYSSYTTHQYTTHHTPLINTPLIIHHSSIHH